MECHPDSPLGCLEGIPLAVGIPRHYSSTLTMEEDLPKVVGPTVRSAMAPNRGDRSEHGPDESAEKHDKNHVFKLFANENAIRSLFPSGENHSDP